MNRFGKRSMEMRRPHKKKGVIRTANDSASQRFFVTVRQMFSDDPVWKTRADFPYFGGDPFPLRRLHDLAGGYWWVPRLYQAIQFWLHLSIDVPPCQLFFCVFWKFEQKDKKNREEGIYMVTSVRSEREHRHKQMCNIILWRILAHTWIDKIRVLQWCQM